jgi:transcription-repair coupling factor (superfamily II helicase)
MNLEVLRKEYADNPRCFQIVAGIGLSTPQQIHLSGLYGSSPAFVVDAVFNHPSASQINHVIILRDAEEAAYFHNTLENITDALDIFYFPSSFKNKKNYRLLNSSHVMLRTEALTKIASNNNFTVNKKYLLRILKHCLKK